MSSSLHHEDTDQEIQILEEELPTEVRRSTRGKQPSSRYSVHEYIMLTDADEPESYEAAHASEQQEKWQRAMREEMDSLQHNHTYDLVTRPKGRRVLRNKWVYKVKAEEKSSQPRYKAPSCEGLCTKEGS